MNCIKCGKELIDGSKFCNGCGTAQPEAVVEEKSAPKIRVALYAVIGVLVAAVILLLILLFRGTGTSDTVSENPVNMEGGQTVNIVGKQETEKDKGTLEDTGAEDVPTETTTEDSAQSQAATLTVKAKAADFAVVKDSDSAKVLKDAGLADKLSVKNGERLIRGKLQLSRKLTAEEKKQFSYEGKVTDSTKKAVPATVYVGTGGKVYIILSKSLPTGDYTVTVTIRVGEESYNKKVVLHLETAVVAVNKKDWAAAYLKEINKLENSEDMYLMLCYMDDDDIPELIVGEGEHKIYTYYNGKVYMSYGYGSLDGNIFCDGGTGGHEYYVLKNHEIVEFGYSNRVEVAVYDDPYSSWDWEVHYYIFENGKEKEVTVEEFWQVLEKWKKLQAAHTEYKTDWISLSEMKKYLKKLAG